MATGAVIAGRRTYENADHWQGDHHDGVPVFVLTHHPPETPPPGSVRFATDGADDCAGQAKAAAGERNVMVHGAGAAQSLLRAGVLDELELHLFPVLLGQGRRLFDALGPDHIELELTRAIEAPHVTICTTASSGRHSRPYAPASRPSTRAAGRSLGSRGGRNAGSAAGVLRGRPKCLELRERYEQFKRRDLYDTHLIALFLDATFIAVRPDGPEEGVLVAWGFSAEGERVLLSVTLGMRESFEDWQALGRDLIARGLGGAPMLIVADGAPGLIKAIEQCWPASDRQRCCVHRARNLYAKLPERERERVKQAYWRALGDAISPSDANQRLKALVDELDRGGYTIAARCLADDLDALVVHLRYPPRHRRRWRSTNLLERSLGEVKRRTKVIGPLPRRAELSHARLGRARPPDHPPDQCWPLEPTATPRTNAIVTRPRRRLSLAPAARPQRACVQRPLRRLPARSKQAWLTATRQARPMPTQRPCVRTVRLDVLISGASARQKVAVTTAQAEEESTTDRMNARAACRRASHPPGSAAGDEIAGGSAAAGD